MTRKKEKADSEEAKYLKTEQIQTIRTCFPVLVIKVQFQFGESGKNVC